MKAGAGIPVCRVWYCLVGLLDGCHKCCSSPHNDDGLGTLMDNTLSRAVIFMPLSRILQESFTHHPVP